MGQRIKIRRDTNANWIAGTALVLADGELGYDKSYSILRLGNGSSPFSGNLVISGTYKHNTIYCNNATLVNVLTAPKFGLSFVKVQLKCQVASNGYAANDTVEMVDSSGVKVVLSSGGLVVTLVRSSVTFTPTILPKAGGAAVAITLGSWTYEVIGKQ